MDIINLSEHVSLNKISQKKNVGIFAIEGLAAGYGLTIGTALRRVLLTSLPGAAVTQVKIKDASHEFSTYPGLQEDLVLFSLNFKKLRFACHSDEPQVVVLSAKGEGPITGEHIKTNNLVELSNPEQVLGHLTKKTAKIDIEITVERGMGYVTTDKNKEKLPVGSIGVDAIFSPIVRVNLEVEDMRVGKKTDFNRATLELETDGTIKPKDAIEHATKVLKDHFSKILGEEVEMPESEEKEEEVEVEA